MEENWIFQPDFWGALFLNTHSVFA